MIPGPHGVRMEQVFGESHPGPHFTSKKGDLRQVLAAVWSARTSSGGGSQTSPLQQPSLPVLVSSGLRNKMSQTEGA